MHNDYKLDNTLLDAADPARTVAVLDWDMCTRGEPLMDLGYLLALWAQRRRRAKPGTAGCRPGTPVSRPARGRRALRAHVRRRLGDLHWYVVFNVFRFAVILQQIYLRYVRGQTHDERFRDFGTAVNALIGAASR